MRHPTVSPARSGGKFPSRLVALPLLALLAACAGSAGRSPAERRALVEMRHGLEAVRAAEASYYAGAGHYTLDPARLRLAEIPGRSVVAILEASDSGFVARAIHPGVPLRCYLVQPPRAPWRIRCAQEGPDAAP